MHSRNDPIEKFLDDLESAERLWALGKKYGPAIGSAVKNGAKKALDAIKKKLP